MPVYVPVPALPGTQSAYIPYPGGGGHVLAFIHLSGPIGVFVGRIGGPGLFVSAGVPWREIGPAAAARCRQFVSALLALLPAKGVWLAYPSLTGSRTACTGGTVAGSGGGCCCGKAHGLPGDRTPQQHE